MPDETSPDVPAMARRALDEIATAFTPATSDAATRMRDEILTARRIVCFGVGREGLMIRALCMRLMHLGFDAHVAGDMTTPPIGPGDLLMVSAGPGGFSTALAMLGVAKAARARSLVVTAQPGGVAPQMADVIVHLPAQTMADDTGPSTSLLPMGSLFEAAELIFFDILSIMLREATGQSAEDMRARHTNLE
ncbi:MAG: SIS domain-containing protein [Thermomicrobiales bacterium]|nr:SIS domain-containing protein [Thermomicrobiales bacterium]